MVVKKTKKSVVQKVQEETVGSTCDATNWFLSTINHPRKLELATGLLNGESPESFYEDYGTVRVQEMMTMIDSYNADPDRYLRNHLLAGCKKCGR